MSPVYYLFLGKIYLNIYNYVCIFILCLSEYFKIRQVQWLVITVLVSVLHLFTFVSQFAFIFQGI